METVHHDWRIVKSINPKFGGAWDIECRIWEKTVNQSGLVKWSMLANWHRHSPARSKQAALARIMLLRERGEYVTWQGSAIRLGIALIDPAAPAVMDREASNG
jgi:hypothetical protein